MTIVNAIWRYGKKTSWKFSLTGRGRGRSGSMSNVNINILVDLCSYTTTNTLHNSRLFSSSASVNLNVESHEQEKVGGNDSTARKSSSGRANTVPAMR